MSICSNFRGETFPACQLWIPLTYRSTSRPLWLFDDDFIDNSFSDCFEVRGKYRMEKHIVNPSAGWIRCGRFSGAESQLFYCGHFRRGRRCTARESVEDTDVPRDFFFELDARKTYETSDTLVLKSSTFFPSSFFSRTRTSVLEVSYVFRATRSKEKSPQYICVSSADSFAVHLGFRWKCHR